MEHVLYAHFAGELHPRQRRGRLGQRRMAEYIRISLCDSLLFPLLSLRIVLPGQLYRKQGLARSARLYEGNEQGDRGRGPGYDRRALHADQRRFPACGGLSGFGRNAAGAQLAHRPLHGLRIVGPGFAGAAELSAGCDFCRKLLEERQTETGHHASGVRLLNNRPVGDAL